MKISIITVCYNSEKTIEDTIKSVLKQTYKDYEYLIIDGKSTDNTVNIIKKYEDKFEGRLKYISEKDKGIYDAMNKGIKMAKGDIIGLINSDDILAHKDVFKKINDTFTNNNIDATYANLVVKDINMDKAIRTYISKKGNYKFGWYPPHPTLYLRKEVYNKYGMFKLDYKIAADYDFMLRIMKNKVSLYYIPETFVYMRIGGVSTSGLENYLKSFSESYKILKNNKIKFPLTVNIIRTIRVLKRIIFKK